MSVLDWWRLSYATVSAVIFVFVSIEFKKSLSSMDRKQLYWSFAILGFILSSCISSLESMYFSDHLSVRTPLFMACSFWCVLALRERNKDLKKKNRKED